MEILIWTVLGAIIAGLASDRRLRKGRILWMLLGAVIGPLLALLLYLPMGPLDGVPSTCPACAERVKPQARLCRYCRTALPPPAPRRRDRPRPNDRSREHTPTPNANANANAGRARSGPTDQARRPAAAITRYPS